MLPRALTKEPSDSGHWKVFMVLLVVLVGGFHPPHPHTHPPTHSPTPDARPWLSQGINVRVAGLPSAIASCVLLSRWK